MCVCVGFCVSCLCVCVRELSRVSMCRVSACLFVRVSRVCVSMCRVSVSVGVGVCVYVSCASVCVCMPRVCLCVCLIV